MAGIWQMVNIRVLWKPRQVNGGAANGQLASYVDAWRSRSIALLRETYVARIKAPVI